MSTTTTDNVRSVKLRKLRYGEIRVAHETTTLRKAEHGIRYRVRIIVTGPDALSWAHENYVAGRIAPYHNDSVLVQWEY